MDNDTGIQFNKPGWAISAAWRMSAIPSVSFIWLLFIDCSGFASFAAIWYRLQLGFGRYFIIRSWVIVTKATLMKFGIKIKKKRIIIEQIRHKFSINFMGAVLLLHTWYYLLWLMLVLIDIFRSYLHWAATPMQFAFHFPLCSAQSFSPLMEVLTNGCLCIVPCLAPQ